MSLLGNFNLYGTTYAIDFSDVGHQHGDTFKVNGHSYCISESLHLDDYVEVYDYESHTHHKVSCECGKIVRYEEHNFIPYLTKGVHPLVAPITNSICSKCGYIKSVFPNI